MAKEYNQYIDSEEEVEEKGKAELFFEQLGSFLINNQLIRLLRRKILLRKTLTFYLILLPIIWLMIGGINSPARVTYSETQLTTSHEFANGTGVMKAIKQTYSKKNNIMVFEFETTDNTSSITKGINASNLEWQLFTPPGVDTSQTHMDVVPLTDNKISVVVRNVPKDYGVMIVRVTNNTVSDSDVDVNIQDYDDYKADQENAKKKTEEVVKYVDFYITPQNGLLKNRELEDLSRENFALKIFNDELSFQKKQVEKLHSSIEKLEKGIEENEATVQQLQREVQYLVGSQLVEKQEEVEKVEAATESKKKQINMANDNLTTLNKVIENLENNIKKVKDGTYEFNSPVRSIKKVIK